MATRGRLGEMFRKTPWMSWFVLLNITTKTLTCIKLRAFKAFFKGSYYELHKVQIKRNIKNLIAVRKINRRRT